MPLIREGRALGTISVRRMEVRPFEQKHIALLTTFADQAAIATLEYKHNPYAGPNVRYWHLADIGLRTSAIPYRN